MKSPPRAIKAHGICLVMKVVVVPVLEGIGESPRGLSPGRFSNIFKRGKVLK